MHVYIYFSNSFKAYKAIWCSIKHGVHIVNRVNEIYKGKKIRKYYLDHFAGYRCNALSKLKWEKCSNLGIPASPFTLFPIVSDLDCPSRQQGEYRAVQPVMSGAQGPLSKICLLKRKMSTRKDEGEKRKREQYVLILLSFVTQVFRECLYHNFSGNNQVQWHFHHRLCGAVDRWHRCPCKPPDRGSLHDRC